MLKETSDYDRLYRDFSWDVPARFFFVVACCVRLVDGSARHALTIVEEEGGVRRVSFDKLAALSRRFVNVLASDGLSHGDRVAVFLSQSLELPIVNLAAFRAGFVSVALFTLFGEDALQFRLQNSGAKAVGTDAVGFAKLAKVRQALPDLKAIYVIDGVADGAK